MKKRYVVVGTGGRARGMFIKPIATTYRDVAELVGFYDINPRRAQWMNDEFGLHVPVYDDFSRMLAESEPDAVIVATKDSMHHEYIIRTLEAGYDAISEKPMTTDADKCRAILEAERKSGRRVIVTFNCRYMPYVVKVKQLLADGAIGNVHSVHMETFLDLSHGASYFRRWHGRMENSGGLLVHKSTHHFDMLNWWLDDEPASVYALGDLRFYGANREQRGTRCHQCRHAGTCSFYYDITANPFTKSFYYDAEQYDGYIGDRCVFGDHIDIYDTMSLNVQYSKGAHVTFSLTAYNPIEGWRASFIGDKGRLEAESIHGSGSGQAYDPITLYRGRGEAEQIRVPRASGGHGGGDERLLDMIFSRSVNDPLGQMADSRAGAMSLLIGYGANESIRKKQPVSIDGLLRSR